MSSDDEYYVPVNVEDEYLRSVADKATDLLNQNLSLESLFQKYIKAYNTFEVRISVNSLQVMNRNHNPIFSSITPSGMIRSPRCSSVGEKKDANYLLRTPFKISRKIVYTERKRLLFDDAEKEDTGLTHASTQTCDVSQLPVISPNKKDEREPAISSNTNPSFNSYGGQTKTSDSPGSHVEERFNFEGKPETITSPSIYDPETAYPLHQTPDKHQTMDTSCEKSITPIRERINARRLVISPSLFSSEEQIKDSDEPNTTENESFRPDEKSETTSSLSLEHKEAMHKNSVVVNANKKEQTPVNSILVKRVLVKPASNVQEFLSPITDIKTPNELLGNKRKSVDFPEESVADTCLVAKDEFVGPSKMAKLHDKKTIDMDDNEFFSYLYDKYVMNDISVVDTCLVAKDEEIVTPPKTNKLDDKKTIDPVDDSAMDDNESCNRSDDKSVIDDISVVDTCLVAKDEEFVGPSKMTKLDDKKTIDSVDDSAMDNNESCNHSDDKSVMDDLSALLLNINMPDKSDWEAYSTAYFQKYASQNFTSYLPPNDKVEDNSSASSSKKDQIRINSTVAHETKDVESLTDLMQNLSPSEMHYFRDSSQKSTRTRSVSDDTSFARLLCIGDNLSKTGTPPRDCLIPNTSSPIPDTTFEIKAEKFTEMLNQRQTRMLSYRQLFIEDKSDLQFVSAYIKNLNDVVNMIPVKAYNSELVDIVQEIIDKSSKLLNKATSWESDVENDLVVWMNCFTKIIDIQQEIKRKLLNLTPEDFQIWEIYLRIVNTKADDMILLRDVRRPTFLQFGYELEGLIQMFIRCILVLGFIKSSSRVSSY